MNKATDAYSLQSGAPAAEAAVNPSVLIDEPVPNAPRVWIDTIEFSSGQLVTLRGDDIVVVVGPNNSGKSITLRNIQTHLSNNGAGTLIVRSVQIGRAGTDEGIVNWVPTVATPIDSGGSNPRFAAQGYEFQLDAVLNWWRNARQQLGALATLFCRLFPAAERLNAVGPVDSYPVTTTAPKNPIQTLYRDSDLEERVSRRFRQAFGMDLIVHRSAGSQIPLYAGERPALNAGELPTSPRYLKALEALTPLHLQGDGMKAFASLLLGITSTQESILLVDEPEAFLHPPQARLLAQVLAAPGKYQRQLLIATHSGDIVRGLLDSGSERVRIVRLTRSGNSAHVRELDRSEVSSLWADTLLRQSNILDGLFHDLVVVGESDSDARFYSAIAEIVQSSTPVGTKRVDVMFVHCGNGKDRMPSVVRALRAIGVAVVALPDFDMLRSEQPLRALVEAAGGQWSNYAPRWRSVKESIDRLDPAFDAPSWAKKMQAVVESVVGRDGMRTARSRINALFKGESPWSSAKREGANCLSDAGERDELVSLLEALAELGIRVVPVGELERFAPSIDRHGPSWVNEVMKRDLQAEPELASAREFIRAALKL